MELTGPAKVEVKEIAQVGFAVRDVLKAADNYWSLLGIGPWKICELHPPTLAGLTYHGRPAQFGMKTATAWVGTMQVELIEPVSGENILAEALRGSRPALYRGLLKTVPCASLPWGFRGY